jgi:hypothetical protein
MTEPTVPDPQPDDVESEDVPKLTGTPVEAGRDDLDWNSEEYGRMAEYATGPEDEPETLPFEDESAEKEPDA